MARTLLSLFDFTGEWSRPFAEAGWEVLQVDVKHGDDVRDFSAAWLLDHVCQGFVIDGIVAAPPCTDFAVSGARHWPAKDADGRTAASTHLVLQTLRAVDFLKPDFWAVENPAGRIAQLVPELGARQLVWEPCDYAGWTDPTALDVGTLADLRAKHARGERMTSAEIDLVKRTNAYTKRTVLYGSFLPPEVRRLEPVRVAAQGSWLQLLGGKSEKTKAERSVTPSGFARAFFEANKRAERFEVLAGDREVWSGGPVFERAAEVYRAGHAAGRDDLIIIESRTGRMLVAPGELTP